MRKNQLLKGAVLANLSGVSGIVGIAIIMSLSVVTAQETTTYPAPDTKAFVFDAKQIPDTLRTEIVTLLTIAASDFPEVSPKARAMCLAIALRLDPVYKPAFMTNFALKSGKVPDVIGTKDFETICADLMKVSKLAALPEANPESRKLAAYLYDALTALDLNNADFAFAAKQFGKDSANPKALWTVIFEGTSVYDEFASNEAAQASKETAAMSEVEVPTLPGIEGSNSSLARTQSLVKGLLVQQLDGNQFAGKASQMNATARKVNSNNEMNVHFNQEVGPSMESALGEVLKFHRERHQKLPSGYDVEISFEEQYIPKDGPSAAVACALLLESLITGDKWETDFAVTGDLNADGAVQPVGGIDGKIRGATRRDCVAVAIPVQNVKVISDILIVDGPKPIIDIQIFSIETFEEAYELAKMHNSRDENLKSAIDKFSEIQAVLQRPNGISYLRNQHVVAKLREVVGLAPNHLSARNLLLAALGRDSKQLSLSGSYIGIDRAAAPLIRALEAGNFEPRKSSLDDDEYAIAISQLTRIRAKLDPRTRNFSDSITSYAKLMKEFVNNPPRSNNNIRSAIMELKSAGELVLLESNKLANRPDVKEELGE